MLSFSSMHIGLHAVILLPKPYILGIWVHTWLVMLSHAVMSVIQLFPSLLYWVCLVLLLRVLILHLLRCEVTVVRIDAVIWAWDGMVETVGFYQEMWFVMLKSAKDRVLGVDTLGQQVSPCVRYGMTCLLIKDVVGCESCSTVCGKTQDVIWSTRYKRGKSHEENLALLAGTRGQVKP
jgi:hypothetical protein